MGNSLSSYAGRILDINLSNDKISFHKIDEKVLKLFIGGKGLGAKLLIDHLEGGLGPISPENLLILATGPLTGTGAPTSGRFVVVTKSPSTGLFTDSHVGGSAGPEIKRAGYDAIIIRGKASHPVYVWVNDDSVEIRDASKIWGLTVSKAVDAVRELTDPKAHVGVIGPAGEKLVKYACIVFDKEEERNGIAARGGPGAVMGSKNLKAIAIKGSHKVEVANPEGFQKAVLDAVKSINENPFIPLRRRFGTAFWVKPMNEHAIIPSLNFQRGSLEGSEKLYADYMRSACVVRDMTCFNCMIACSKLSKVTTEDGELYIRGPEYETIALLGTNNGIKDIHEVARAVYLCNELGLDAISTGNVIGWVMECCERGILTPSDCDGLDIKFGEPKIQRELIRRIAFRDGWLGNLLAEGVARASKIVGKGSERFAMHVKGLEIPGYDPRSSNGMALAYATSDRGACHQRAWTTRAEIEGRIPRFSIKGKAKFVKEVQDERAAAFSLVICDFAPIPVVEMLNNATGYDYTVEEYLKCGERIWNLIRVFNCREGVSRKDDTLPPRVFEDPLPDPAARGAVVTRDQFNEMLDEYYILRGWDSNGIPTKEKLHELGLDDLIRYVR